MNIKQIAGERAADFVEDGMVLGLGTGSTAFFTIQKIGEKVSQGLKITGVCTSEETRLLAESLKIPYVDLDDVEKIDLTIDGADEVDPMGNGIKGGGGALLYEKIAASVSTQIIWVIEQRKLVDRLGNFPLPVEIMPYGHKHCLQSLTEKGYNPQLRISGKKAYLTDGGHYIADLHTGLMEDPFELEADLQKITGVVENGLFLNTANKAIVASNEAVDIITYR
jgi:ribose 5-phosphate isomerase A